VESRTPCFIKLVAVADPGYVVALRFDAKLSEVEAADTGCSIAGAGNEADARTRLCGGRLPKRNSQWLLTGSTIGF